MDFALVKTVAVVGIGPIVSDVKTIFTKSVVSADPLREKPKVGGCCSVQVPFQGEHRWSFWREEELIEIFKSSNRENEVFLLKCLALAYVIDALILRDISAEWIAGALGCQDVGAILLGAFVGAPASFERLCCGSFVPFSSSAENKRWCCNELHARWWVKQYTRSHCCLRL